MAQPPPSQLPPLHAPVAESPNAELPEMGLLSKLADKSSSGLRASFHKSIQNVLDNSSELMLLGALPPDERLDNRVLRSLFLQQDGDVFQRFDCFYESFPNSLMGLRQCQDASSKAAFMDKVVSSHPCCMDRLFTRRLCTKGESSLGGTLSDICC